MAAATRNLVIEQGATFRDLITWKTGTPAVAVNLTGYAARMMLKASPVKEASQITDITQANPGVVTTKGPHGLANDKSVVLPGVAGMVELTARYLITVLTPTTFSIGVDTTLYTPYTAGGSVAFVSLTDVLGGDGQIILGGAAGTIETYIKDSVTDSISGGGSYDLELITPSPVLDVKRLTQGAFSVSPNTTR